VTRRLPFAALVVLTVHHVLGSSPPAQAATPTTGTAVPTSAPPPSDTSTPGPANALARPLATRVGAFSTTAFGLSGGGFLNELAGARVDLEYTPRFLIGFSLAYANLKGKDGRVSNALPEAILGYRVPLGRVVGVPFHMAGGYLAKNGPTLRVGAGLDFRLGERARLELMLLEPMVWVTEERPESSLNLGLGFSAQL
jgi:hypothetical protein